MFTLDVVVCVFTCRLSVVGVRLSWSSKLQGAVCSPQRRSPQLTWSKPVQEYSMVMFIYSYSKLTVCINSLLYCVNTQFVLVCLFVWVFFFMFLLVLV